MKTSAFLDCEVLRPDGKLVRLDPDAIREGGEQSVADYSARAAGSSFRCPEWCPVRCCTCATRRHGRRSRCRTCRWRFRSGRSCQRWTATVAGQRAEGTPFHFAFGADCGRRPGDQANQLRHDLLVALRELFRRSSGRFLCRRGNGRGLLISTFPDWAAFAEWYARISKLTDEVTPEIAAKAEELTPRGEGRPGEGAGAV